MPVGSIDLSGRGNSIVSLWRHPASAAETCRRRESAKSVHGAHRPHILEIVQITALCHPWCVRFVRTVTIRRRSRGPSGAATVAGRRRGWPACLSGARRAPELGAIRRLTAITNIRELAELHQLSPLDAAARRPFRRAGRRRWAEGMVPVRDVKGWVEARPAPEPRTSGSAPTF